MNRFFKSLKVILTVGTLLLLGYLYAGFYYPDPFAVNRWSPYSRYLIIAFKAGIPFILIGIFALSFAVRRGKVARSNVLLTLASFAVCMIIFSPFAKMYFEKIQENRRGNHTYHPYFQLSPPIPALGKHVDDFNIYCLGGSTTEWTDHTGRGWPDRLEDLLNKNCPDSIHVENLGMQWFTTFHTLMNYEVNLRSNKPDVILVMHTINDLLQNADFCYFSFGKFRDDYGHFYGPISRVMRRKSMLQQVLEIIGHFWYHIPREVILQNEFPGLVVFEQNLNSIIDLAEKDNVRVILLTQPNLYKPDISTEEQAQLDMLNFEAIGPDKKWAYESAFNGFLQYSEVIRKVAVERKVMLIDLEKQIPKSLQYLKDDVHYQEAGFDAVAEAVANVLKGNAVVN